MPHPTIPDTIHFMTGAHTGQFDKGGNPYYLHPLSVCMRLINPTSAMRHAALLHDVVEDTDCTLGYLRLMGYSDEVITLVDLLSQRKDQGESHRVFIDRLLASGNVDALTIKLADNADNSCWSRFATMAPEHRGLVNRIAEDRERIQAAISLYITSTTRFNGVIEGDL
jgi:(p)ppGpp synthase/HD superfamily hydrolase